MTSEFFTLLGASPVLGRAFTEADLRRDARHVVLSHRLWRDRFAGDREVVGKVVRVNREPWTVIGVLLARRVDRFLTQESCAACQ